MDAEESAELTSLMMDDVGEGVATRRPWVQSKFSKIATRGLIAGAVLLGLAACGGVVVQDTGAGTPAGAQSSSGQGSSGSTPAPEQCSPGLRCAP